jgi:hypothetical protein
MNGNYTTDPGTDMLGYPPGSPANFVVVGWSANIGTTWGIAQAWWNNRNPNSGPSGYFAISSVATDVIVGGGGVPVPTIFGPTVGREVQGFTLNYYEVGASPPPFTIQSINGSGNSVSFTWYATTGLVYQVQYTTNLSQTNWTALTNILASDGATTASDIKGPDLYRFYRVVLLPWGPSWIDERQLYNRPGWSCV